MAFDSAGWVSACVSKRGNAPSLYLYTTADTQATINTAGYFNDLVNTLEVGDIIMCYDSTTPSLVVTYVLSNDGTDVDVADGTTISATDTD